MRITRARLFKEINDVIEEMMEEGAGSPWHDQMGRFVNPDRDKGSYSKDGIKGKRTSRSRSVSKTDEPCGRDGRYKCKGGAKWGDGADVKQEMIVNKGQDRFRTKHRSEIFSGWDDLRKLSAGIVENAFDNLNIEKEDLDEGVGKKCFTSQELSDFKKRIVNGLWQGISNFKRADKGEWGA